MLTLISPRKASEEMFRLFCTPLAQPKMKMPSIFKSAEKLTETIDGLTISGFRWNKGQPKKVMILHGFSSQAQKFQHFVSPLIKKGYEVLAFDAQAHGESEGIMINALVYSNMIVTIANKYGPLNAFIGHSLGGLSVCLALEQLPHDINTKVVLLAPATETATAADMAFDFLKVNNEKVRKGFDDIIVQLSGRHTTWYSVKRAMQNIKATILWIHDEDDDVTPLSDALKVKELNLPNIQFIITKGFGHRRIYKDNDIKNKVIDFL